MSSSAGNLKCVFYKILLGPQVPWSLPDRMVWPLRIDVPYRGVVAMKKHVPRSVVQKIQRDFEFSKFVLYTPSNGKGVEPLREIRVAIDGVHQARGLAKTTFSDTEPQRFTKRHQSKQMQQGLFYLAVIPT